MAIAVCSSAFPVRFSQEAMMNVYYDTDYRKKKVNATIMGLIVLESMLYVIFQRVIEVILLHLLLL